MLLLSRLIGPVILFLATAAALALSSLGITPQLSNLLKEFFSTYGIFALGPIVFIEYLYGVNFFFPGAFTIIFAMSSSHGNSARALEIFTVIWIVSLMSSYTSYALGLRSRNGLSNSIEHPTRTIGLSRRAGIALAYAHPLTTSIRCFQRGVSGASRRSFVFELTILNLVWNMFWGLVSYNFGSIITEGNTFSYILLAYSIYWFSKEARKLEIPYFRITSKY